MKLGKQVHEILWRVECGQEQTPDNKKNIVMRAPASNDS
jgi:hypothetical protein